MNKKKAIKLNVYTNSQSCTKAKSTVIGKNKSKYQYRKDEQ